MPHTVYIPKADHNDVIGDYSGSSRIAALTAAQWQSEYANSADFAQMRTDHPGSVGDITTVGVGKWLLDWSAPFQPGSSEVGDPRFVLRSYERGFRRLTKEEAFETDNGDGTYSDKVSETTYTYSGKKLTQKVIKTFHKDGSLANTETCDFFTEKEKEQIIEKRS